MAAPIYKGPFGGSLTRSGHPVDEAKSLLQKAIRRGLTRLAVSAALELYEFKTIEGGKAIASNMINRLIVIAGEDIGVGCIDLLPWVDKRVAELREETNYACAQLQLARIVITMCASTKSRLVSHTRACLYFPTFAPHVRPAAIEAVPELEDGLDFVGRKYRDVRAPQFGIDLDDLATYQKCIVAIKEWNMLPGATRYLGVRYALKLRESKNQYKIERGWPKKRMIASNPVFFIWNFLLGLENPAIDTCYKWYLNENEPSIYLMLAICIAVTPEVPRIVIHPRFCESIVSMKRFKMPLWAVDKHTEAGRNAGKTAVDFAHEGSRVVNGWELFPGLEAGYVKIRSML